MRLPFQFVGAAGSALLLTEVAAAQQAVIQIVDLTELGMSTEGGEATLYRVKDAQPTLCKIDVIHYGETGRTILEFEFGSKLLAAEEREYRYKAPLSVDPKAKPVLTRKVSLDSREGRQTLTKEFETYKSLFDASHLAKCRGR